MPGTAVNLGTGSYLVMAKTRFILQNLNITFQGMSRAAIDTTHLRSTIPRGLEMGGRTFLFGLLADPGQLVIEGHWNPQQVLPLNRPAERITVYFPRVAGDRTPARWVGTGGLIAWDGRIPLEEKMTSTLTFKWSGRVVLIRAV